MPVWRQWDIPAVQVVVANVTVLVGSEAARASLFMKTSAKPGAGTVMAQLLEAWSQATVVIVSSPFQRPSKRRDSDSDALRCDRATHQPRTAHPASALILISYW